MDTETPEPAALVKAAVQSLDALVLQREPAAILAEAEKAAAALMAVMARKPHKVILNGEQYLENEDWLTIGHFYGVTAQLEADTFVTYGEVHGWEATAILVSRDGRVLGRCTAMCLDDEKNWKTRPLFQLRSMAQTRASSRVHASVLRFVPVLAGFKATPAEELTDPDRVVVPPPPLGSVRPFRDPVIPPIVDGTTEVAPGLHVAPQSSSVFPSRTPPVADSQKLPQFVTAQPAPGLHLLTNPRMEGGFHTWTVPNWDAEGGSITVSTKLERVIQAAEIACAERRPVRLRVTMRKDRKASGYLNGVLDDDPQVPADEIF